MEMDAAKPLALDAVNAFVLVAELGSFTRAAEAFGTTQSAISLKLKRLERRLGRRLLEPTPRLVRLSPEGAALLDRARDLLAAHQRALAADGGAVQRLALGISDHAAGPELPLLIARLNAQHRALLLEVRLGFSADLVDAFDAGGLDAVIVRREDGGATGSGLSPTASAGSRGPTTGTSPESRCGWRCSRPAAACVRWRRIAPAGLIDLGPALGLPELPPSEVMLHSRVSDARLSAALRTVAAAFRSAGR